MVPTLGGGGTQDTDFNKGFTIGKFTNFLPPEQEHLLKRKGLVFLRFFKGKLMGNIRTHQTTLENKGLIFLVLNYLTLLFCNKQS